MLILTFAKSTFVVFFLSLAFLILNCPLIITDIVNVCTRPPTRPPSISAMLAKRIGLLVIRDAIHDKMFFFSLLKDRNSEKSVILLVY